MRVYVGYPVPYGDRREFNGNMAENQMEIGPKNGFTKASASLRP